MKWKYNLWKTLETAVSKLLLPFLVVFGLSFLFFAINGTLVFRLKEVNSLLHATTLLVLLYGLFHIVKSYHKFIVAPGQVFQINKKKTIQLVVGSLLALVISFFCLCFLYLYRGQYSIDVSTALLPQGGLSILLSFLVAAFFEELLMRYFLLGLLLKNKWSFWLSIVLSSAFFSSIHNYQSESIEWFLYIHAAAFLLGVCFCLVYWAYGSFWLVVFIHAMWNVINGLFYEGGTETFLKLDELQEVDYTLYFVIIYLVLSLLIASFYKKANRKYLSINSIR